MFAIVKEDLIELLSTYPQIAEKMWKSYGTKIGIPLLQELPEYQVLSKIHTSVITIMFAIM